MTRRILAVLAAVLLAMVGTTAVFAYVKGADRRALAGQDAVTVFVADRIVPAGTDLKRAVDSGLLRKELVARKAAPTGAIADVDKSNQSLVALTEIVPGETALASRFGTEMPLTTAVEIPKGKMAVTVNLEDPQRVAPFLRAGDEVAIFTSAKLRRERTKDDPGATGEECAPPDVCFTRVVLARVQVLGVGEASAAPQDEQSPEEPSTDSPQDAEAAALITLAVGQREAEKIIHLSRFGNMHFALLSPDSGVSATDGGVTDLNFFDRD